MTPWGPSDARSKTRKANTPKKQRQWAHVADAVLASTGDEGRAVRTANGVIRKRKGSKIVTHTSGMNWRDRA
jgi:hypothetical protein